MKYIDWLNNGYKFYCEQGNILSKKEYLADYIFEFTTYDSEMAELFSGKALDVCKAINERETFEYIESSVENYKWFLIMCNMPFFAERINWGTSIRGAWWSYDTQEYSSCGLWDNNGRQLYEKIIFTDKEWKEFINAIIEFAKE